MKNNFYQQKKAFIKIFFFVLLASITLSKSFAATKTWTGAVSTAWGIAGNWSGSTLPISTDAVVVPGVANMPVMTTGTYTLYSITIQTGATLTQTGGTLTVTGSSVIVTGTFAQSGGILYTNKIFKVAAGGIFNQSGTGLLHLNSSASNPVVSINIASGGTINQSGGTIHALDYITSPGTFNQTGATALFKLHRKWKPGAGSIFNAVAGTVEFTGGPANGSSKQSDYATGTRQFNNILVGSGVNPKFDGNNNNKLYISGNFTNNNNSLDVGTSATFIFNGTNTQTIRSTSTGSNATFGHFTVNKTGGTLTLATNVTVAGDMRLTAGIFDMSTYTFNRKSSGGLGQVDPRVTVRLAGTTGGKTGSNFPTNYTSGSISASSTVEYYGSGQTIFATTYGNLVISSAGTKTAGGILTIAGNFTLSTGTFVGGNYTHNVARNWTMASGTFTNTNTIINFNGTVNQTISSSGAFNRIILNKTSGLTYCGTDITASTLTFTKGILNTGVYKMIIPSGGSVTGAASGTGWVFGSLQKYYSAAAGGTYELGGAAYYTPMQVAFSSVTTAGSLIGSVTSNSYPNVCGATISSRNISRYWTLTKPASGAIVYPSATLTFNWNIADNYSPMTSALLKVANYNGTAWSYPSISGTPATPATSITATGVTTTGDFTVGEVTSCSVAAAFSYSTSLICTNYSTVTAALGCGASAGTFTSSPAGLSMNSSTGAINPAASSAGIYTITNTVAGSCTVLSNKTVLVSASPSATISYGGTTFCQSGGTINATITGTTGGTFTSTTGLNIDYTTGQIDPTNSDAGTYTITYTIPSSSPCVDYTTTTTVTIGNANYANISYSADAYCLNGGVVPVEFDGTPGGTFTSTAGLSINSGTGAVTLATSTVGIYTVTYSGAASNGCAAFIGTAVIDITSTAPSTIAYNTPFCSNGSLASATITGANVGMFSSTAGLSLDNASGDIDPAASTAGSYTVKYDMGGCYSSSNIVINPAPSATIAYTSGGFCKSVVTAQPVIRTGTAGGVYSASPAGLTINGSTGAITPSSSTAGPYTITYTVAASGGCSVYTTSAAVTIIGTPAASISYEESPFCTSLISAQAVKFSGNSGGVFSAPAGLSINSANGDITPSTSTPGTYAVTYTISGCSSFSATTSVTVTGARSATISYTGSPYCKSIITSQSPTLTGTTGGTFTSSSGDLSINASTGVINPSASAAKTYTVTYTIAASGGCAEMKATASVTITAPPAPGISYDESHFCKSVADEEKVSLTGSGGTFSASAGLSINTTTGAIVPSTSTAGVHTVTYTIPAANGCAGVNASTSVTITAVPTANISYTGAPFCMSITTAQSATITGTTGGTFTASSGDLSINASTGAIIPSASAAKTYTVTYTIPASGGCEEVEATATVSVNTAPTATISYGTGSYCPSGLITVSQTGSIGGTYSSTTGLSLNALTGAVNLGTSTSGAYTVTYTTGAAAGCAGYTATTGITVLPIGTWTGASGTSWTNAANWQCGIIPSGTTNVTIPSGMPSYPVINTMLPEIKNLTLQANTSITITNGSLKIGGNVTTAGGKITATSGKVEFNGTSSQTIPAALFSLNTIKDLVLTNPAGVTLTGTLRLTNALSFGNVNNSTFNAAGYLTISSAFTGNAYIADITNGGVNSGNNISGAVTVERYVRGKRAYRFLTAPVNSTLSIRSNWMEGTNNPNTATWNNPNPGFGTHITGTNPSVNGFDATGTNNPSMFTFNLGTQNWSGIPNTSGLFQAGHPYRIMVRGSRSVDLANNSASPSSTTLRATGTLVTGDVVFTKAGGGGTANMPALTADSGKYSFVANPYASAVDWLQLNRTNISSTIYIFDPTISGSNGRGAYVAFNGSLNAISHISSLLNNNIQSGQAFFVQTTGPNPSLTFKEQYKSNIFRPVFRNTSTVAKLNVSLQLQSQTGTDNAADGVAAYFSDDFDNAVGDDDSYKFANPDENIAINRNGTTLSLEGRHTLSANDTIQLKSWQLRTGTYTFKILMKDFAPDVEAYFYDDLVQSMTKISNNDTAFISFDVSSAADSAMANRFKIVFRLASAMPLNITSIKAYQKDKGIQTEWTAESEVNVDRYELERSPNATAFKKLASVAAKNTPLSQYSYYDAKPLNGDNYYRIKAIDKSAAVKYSRIVKVKSNESIGSVNVMPNPVQGNSINLVFTDMEAGLYKMMLLNNAGQVVYIGSVKYNGGTENKVVKVSNALPSGIYQMKVSNDKNDYTSSVMVD